MRPVRFEQAVFTSATSSRGQGYRIVAASSGLTPDERRMIQRCAPSHGGLCSDDPDAISVGFIPLPSGRLCAMCSTHAGMEQTGRGGRRVYTHILVFRERDFAEFAFNPFHILRTAYMAGALTPDPSVSGTLECLELTPSPDDIVAANVAAGLENIELQRMRDCLEHLLAGDKLVLCAPSADFELAEALWIAIPAPQRSGISFASGLKFSLTRGLTLHFVDSDNAPAPRVLRGPGIERVDLTQPMPQPAPSDRSWGAMVEILWKDRAIDDLITVSSSCDLDEVDDGLDRIIGLTLDAHAVPRADFQSVITLCTNHAGTAPYSQTEGKVLEWFWLRVGRRLVELWPIPQNDAARTHWHVLSELPHRNPLVPSLIADSLVILLNRLADHDALDAMASGLVLARAPRNPWVDAVTTCEPVLLERLLAWATGTDDASSRAQRCLALAQEWQNARPGSERAARAVQTLQQHLDPTEVEA